MTSVQLDPRPFAWSHSMPLSPDDSGDALLRASNNFILDPLMFKAAPMPIGAASAPGFGRGAVATADPETLPPVAVALAAIPPEALPIRLSYPVFLPGDPSVHRLTLEIHRATDPAPSWPSIEFGGVRFCARYED